MSSILDNVVNTVSSWFAPKSNYLPSSAINKAAYSATYGNPYYDKPITDNVPLSPYNAMNNYGKTMTALNQQQQQIQPAVDEANFAARMVNLGYNSPYYQKPGAAPAAFPYGASLSAPAGATQTNYGVQSAPVTPAVDWGQFAKQFSAMFNQAIQTDPSTFLGSPYTAPNTSAFTTAANRQPTSAEQWLKQYI